MELKSLKGMSLKQQLLFVESYLPDAWEYLHDIDGASMPQFDDNDEMMIGGKSHHESIFECRTLAERES